MDADGEGQLRPEQDGGGRRTPDEIGERRRPENSGESRRKPEEAGEGRRRQEKAEKWMTPANISHSQLRKSVDRYGATIGSIFTPAPAISMNLATVSCLRTCCWKTGTSL